MLSSTSPIDRPSLHPGTRYLITPRVPHGLATVVEGLTREVLRHRPEDIYVFAAHHFEKLLKLREQYHSEEYSGREFDHEFSYEFKLWPTKKAKDIRKSSNSDWSLEKEIEIFEKRKKVSADIEESTDVSTDRENQKTLRQTCSKSLSTTKKTSKKSKDNETISDIRARIISQISVLPGKTIQTKDIKQELRRNKLSNQKAKVTDDTEKGIRNEKRSKTKIPKTNKNSEEEAERATTTTTTTTTSSSRTSARRPLRKVRRIETESETETEHEILKTEHENGYERSNVKDNDMNNETNVWSKSRKKRSEARFSEHSSERKVSSRALSMDRIRAYVLRKFASTASLEVLRSPTYVEQVQEVIDRAAPIIKEKLEEIRGPRGKRSRSVDLSWNKESFCQRIRDGKKSRDYEKEEENKRKTGNDSPERKVVKKEEMENSLSKDETISNVETEKKKLRRRSVGGSGKKLRRHDNGDNDDVEVNNKHNDKLQYESGITPDTLEAKLNATQNILEDISKSIYDLGSARNNDYVGDKLPESEISDHANVVSLPIVRPSSSRNSRSVTRNGSDNLTLPPISPEVPRSMKKKDELFLPVLPVAANGNHSIKKSQDTEEASTMHDITNDIEDITILSEDDKEMIIDVKQDNNLMSNAISEVRCIDAQKHEKDEDINVFLENISEQFTEKRGSSEEFERMEEIFKDSLNVTPDVIDVPPRSDSLESDEEKRLQNDDVDLARINTFDELKDKLIEIEMAERNIEIALAGQQLAMHDGSEETSQAEKSMIDGKINDMRKLANEEEEIVNEIEKSTDKISMNKDNEEKKRNDDEEEKNVTNEIEKIKDLIEISINQEKNLLNETKKSNDNVKEKIKESSNENTMENTTNEAEILKNGIEMMTSYVEILTKTKEEIIKDEKFMDKTERNEKLPTDMEKSIIQISIEDEQSINSKSQNKNDQITQAVICETDDDNITASKNKVDNSINEFSKIIVCKNALNENDISATNLSDENTKIKARKEREIDKLPTTTSLSLELPFSYVLSEGSPCEIPDSVTTVIIPDRHCPSSVTLENENYQFELTNQKEKSFIHFNIDKKSETHKNECNMEIFGEYIQPEATLLPIDIDFIHNREIKSNQIVIVHQDLDRIKEEGEEEEKKDIERKKIESPREQKDKQLVIHEELTKLAILEDIIEHEENEETGAKVTFKSKDAEEISCKVLEHESLLDTAELIADTGLTGEENFIISRDTTENSLEENGSTQDTHTITSSNMKESSASNQSIESSSLDKPVVPELNLDSLQDNTVSSFKMTANETATKEDNSPRESDTTTSLIEPLISDERLMNQPILAGREEDVASEELTESLSRYLHSEVPEADQLYQAEHAEYEWLEKDLSSSENNLEDETKSEENSIGLKALPEDVVLMSSLIQDKEIKNKLESEEEIARELISSLEDDMQFYDKELTLEKKSKAHEESEKSSLDMNDESNRSLPEFVDEQEKRNYEISSKKIQILDQIRTEVTNDLFNQMLNIKQDDKDKNTVIIDNEIKELKEEKDDIEIKHVAPLAQFEQDELDLKCTQTMENDEEKIAIKSKLNIIDATSTDNPEDKQTGIDELIESSSTNNESTNKIEGLHEQQQENEEKIQVKEEYEQEKLEVEEKQKQEKLEVHEEQEKSEKYMQEDLKIQEKDDYENLQLQEKSLDIKIVPLKATESRKGSIESTNEYGKTELNNTCDEFVRNSDNETEQDMKNEIEKVEDLSTKIEDVYEPITSVISEESKKDYFHGGYWITKTKSSTVETVIENSNLNDNTDERIEPAADVQEIIKDESSIRKKDFYLAVVKIQA